MYSFQYPRIYQRFQMSAQYFNISFSKFLHLDFWRDVRVIFSKFLKNSPEILCFWTDSTCFYAPNSLHCCKINFIKWGRQLEGFIWHLTTCAKWGIFKTIYECFKNVTFLWKYLLLDGDWWLWKSYIMFHSLSPNLHITAYQWHGDWGLPQKLDPFWTNISS